MKTNKPLAHMHTLIEELQFFDTVTANVKRKQAAKRRKKFDEIESLRLARTMALENPDQFEDFCEAQYPTQGKILYNALRRAGKLVQQ